MSGADDLRTCAHCPACGFAEDVNSLPCLDAGYPDTKDSLGDCPGLASEGVYLSKKELGDPVRSLAILNLIGDVDEAWLSPERSGTGWALSREQKPHHYERVFVVRPRGEATDAARRREDIIGGFG